MEDINICLEESLDSPLPRVDPHRVAPKYASDFNAVAGFADVYQFFISAKRNRVRSLAIGHVVWCFLKFYDLLVGELASIVHDLH